MELLSAQPASLGSFFYLPRFEDSINTFAHLQRWPSIVAMPPVSPSPAPSQDRISDSEAAEILRLKRKLAATHQELDEARGSRLKKIP